VTSAFERQLLYTLLEPTLLARIQEQTGVNSSEELLYADFISDSMHNKLEHTNNTLNVLSFMKLCWEPPEEHFQEDLATNYDSFMNQSLDDYQRAPHKNKTRLSNQKTRPRYEWARLTNAFQAQGEAGHQG